MKKKLSQFVLKAMGWKTENIIPDVPKCVIVVAPHTSNLDFIIGKLAYTSIGRTAHFLIKKSWFVFPFNIFFRSIGGIPVERSKNTSVTDMLAKEFKKRDEFQLAITPEGTRKKVSRWKKGFYYISLKAEVPIVLIALDYGKKTISFLDVFHPTGNVKKDIQAIRSQYDGVQAKHPQQFVQ